MIIDMANINNNNNNNPTEKQIWRLNKIKEQITEEVIQNYFYKNFPNDDYNNTSRK